MKYICEVCAYEHETEDDNWAELEDGFSCPVCGSPKSYFKVVVERKTEEDGTETVSQETTYFECTVCAHKHEAQHGFLDDEGEFTCPVCQSPKNYFTHCEPVLTSVKIDKGDEDSSSGSSQGVIVYECEICGYIVKAGPDWKGLKDGFLCPICQSPKSFFKVKNSELPTIALSASSTSPTQTTAQEDTGKEATQPIPAPPTSTTEKYFLDIKMMADSGRSIIEPMRTRENVIGWEDILIKGSQLYKLPLLEEVSVNTSTVIGPKAKKPLIIEAPIFITHMSFGALSREAKIALAKGSAAVKTAMCSGEGGILEKSFDSSYRYIFEYVPNLYGVTEENLKRVDAVEIKFGQSTKPGMGGHLPGEKVTEEISEVRGFAKGKDIISSAHFSDITNKEELKAKVDWLRETSGGRPIGIKIAAGHIEKDMGIAVYAGPDFITVDGRPGGTGASAKYVKAAASMPTLFALHRARKFLDESGHDDISLIMTGGFRVSPDYAKALAMGADAVAIGQAAVMALGCFQHRICHTGKCRAGIMTQDLELRKNLVVDVSAKRVENYLKVCIKELKDFARLTGNDDVHCMSIEDLMTVNSEISDHTDIEHV